MALTLQQKEKFFKDRKKIGKVILNTSKKRGLIIFGARSVNKQVPAYLRSHTEDYDIYTPNVPKKTARRIERKLDRRFKGNFFEVKEAAHPGTYKVTTIIGQRGIADISKKPDKIKLIKRKGVYYAHVDYQKEKIKESLMDPKSKFRHGKDKESRLRIELAEKKRKIIKPKIKTKNFIKRARKVGVLPKNAFTIPKIRGYF